MKMWQNEQKCDKKRGKIDELKKKITFNQKKKQRQYAFKSDIIEWGDNS